MSTSRNKCEGIKTKGKIESTEMKADSAHIFRKYLCTHKCRFNLKCVSSSITWLSFRFL